MLVCLRIQRASSGLLYRAVSRWRRPVTPEVPDFHEMRKMVIGLLITWVLCLFLTADCRSYRGREIEDEPDQELGKRQFNDYGHMRFGKRGGVTEDKFEDYGYMRFGRRQP